MDYKTRFNLLAYLTGTSCNDYARAIGASPPNFPLKCKNGKFTIAQLKTIANVAGAEYVARFVTKDGIRIDGNSLKEILEQVTNGDTVAWQRMAMIVIQNSGKKLAVNYKTITDDEVKRTLSKYDYHHYVQSINSKLKNDKMTDETRREFAKAVSCKYEAFFILPNGKQI